MKFQPSNLFDAVWTRLKQARERLRLFRGNPGDGESHAALEQKLILTVKKSHWFPRPTQLISLPRLLSRVEQTVFIAALIIFVISTALLANSLATRRANPAPTSGGNYTEAMIGSPSLINPLWANVSNTDRDLAALLFAGLFRLDSDLAPVPDLAESYEISEDEKTYTILLKPNLIWHDGEPLTAGDVAFTIRAIQEPAQASPRRADFTGVNVEARDAQTIVFTLENPNAHFLSALTVGIIPEHRWGTTAPATARLSELNTKPIGAGPYQLKSIKKTRQGLVHSYILERFPGYHGAPPFLDTLTFRFFDDSTAAAQALAQGNVDGLAFLPYELAPLLSRRRSIASYALELPQTTALFLNQKKNGFLAEKNIRAALALAIDKPLLVGEAFHNQAAVLDGPLPWSATPESTIYPYDRARAETLLAEAGWELKEGATVRTFKPKDKKDKRFVAETELKVKLMVVDVPEYVQAAGLVGEAWQTIGVGVELIITKHEVLTREILPERNFDALLHGILMDARLDPFPFWHSSQAAAPGANIAQYANRRVDGLLEEARRLPDATERTARYDEFQKIVTAELPAIFLLSPQYNYTMDNRVQGVPFGRLGSPEQRFRDVANWYVRTK